MPDEWQELVLRGWMGVRPDGKWAAPRCGLAVPRQNGKNGVLEIRELYGMVALGERFLHTAHEVKTARKAFLRLLSFFDNARKFPELHELVQEIRKTNGQEAIVLKNGGSVEFIARSKGSGRGFSVDVLVLDEAQELADEKFDALLPTISVSPNPQRIFTGTPPSPLANGEVFKRIRNVGLVGKDRRVCWQEWGNLPSADLDDLDNLARANPALGIRLALETARDERAEMDDEAYGRERLGIWADDDKAGATVSMPVWDALADPQSHAVGGVVYALDVDPDQSRAALAVAGERVDGLTHADVGLVQRSTNGLVEFIDGVVEKHGAITVVIDGRSPAAAYRTRLEEMGVEVVIAGLQDVAQGTRQVLDAIDEGTIRHRGQPELTDAVRAARTRAVGDGAVALTRKGADGITPFMAFMLAVWGFSEGYGGGFTVH